MSDADQVRAVDAMHPTCYLHGCHLDADGSCEAERLLRELFGYIEDGTLVRDITGDGDSKWALKLMPFMATLSKVSAYLERKP